MNPDSIGKNIKMYRKQKGFSQEELAEKTNLSTNYIGMIERNEKTPSLDTLIKIVNVLEISADLVLADVLSVGYTVRNSLLDEKIKNLSPQGKQQIYDVIDTMLKYVK